jgi:hypothetical protein
MTKPAQPADVDPDEWAPDDAETRADNARFGEAVDQAAADLPDLDSGAIPEAISDPVTANNPIGDLLDQARTRGYDAAAAHVVEQLGQTREEVIDTFRALWTIFEIERPTWLAAEEWIRRRLTPL